MHRPDISVVIPTYNRKEYLQQAIASCFDGNDEVDVEVVVVDDGSTDGTRKYLEGNEDSRVRPIFQKHRGGQVARNRGLTEAQGTYVKFLDDDDWLAGKTLATEVKALNQSGADLTFGEYIVRSSGEDVETVRPPKGDDFISLLFEGTKLIIPLNLSYRRTFVQDLAWDTSLPCRQDYAFALEVGLKDPDICRLNRITGFKREHQQASVSSRAAQNGNTAHVHGSILLRAAKSLYAEGELCSERQQSVLKGLWTWAHVLASSDMDAFWTIYSFIEEVAPGFRPKRASYLLETLDHALGPPTTERVLYPIRAVKRKVSF